MEDNSGKELADKTHEGFEITCKQCGCSVVVTGSDMGFSEMSGGWGGVYLECTKCTYRTYLMEL